MQALHVRWVVVAFQIIGCLALLMALIYPEQFGFVGTLTGFLILGGIFVLSVAVGHIAVKQVTYQQEMAEEAQETGHQLEQLFNMTDMMQSADGNEDAGAVVTATAKRLLPEMSGALYVFNNSRDRLDLVAQWNEMEGFSPSDTLLPNNCWALKRGKVHYNEPQDGGLCCMHHIGQSTTMELPMMARGVIHGLLVLALDGDYTEKRLASMRRVARALSESMSLALSNIALREKLQTQSLRDPLTGLYNRRYMEDALERFVSLTERHGTATSVVMIDLDDFKKVNDEHGHAKGDAVLRDVAAQLLGAVRPTDVVARYGGEELMVIMPGCGLDDAMGKAENMRQRVEHLSHVHQANISASFGVATVPENSKNPNDVVPLADGALYKAKKEGKNCVRCADRLPEEESKSPRLAVG